MSVRVGGTDQRPRPDEGGPPPEPRPAPPGRSRDPPPGDSRDSRGPQHGARRGVAQAVAGHSAHVAFTASDEPHAVHGAVERREAHGGQVRHAQWLPGHRAGHGARLRATEGRQGQQAGLGPGVGRMGGVSGREGGCSGAGDAHRLLQLGGLGLGGQGRDPEAGQRFVLVLACGACTGPRSGIICKGKWVRMPHPGKHPVPRDPHSLASRLPLTWAVLRGSLGRERVEGPAHDGCLLL